MVFILAGLQLPVPVRCYQTPAAWQAAKEAALVTIPLAAYYVPRDHPLAVSADGPYIALSPRSCRDVRHANDAGAYVLGHELHHYRQDKTGQPFCEDEADRAGWRNLHRWKARLRAHFRLPAPAAAVRLAP